jgi:hypothetical protein
MDEKWNENVETCPSCGIKWKKIGEQCPACYDPGRTKSAKEKMTEREKELGELNDLIFKHSSEGSLGLLAREIQQAGYTKKHFPVEKLEERLEKTEIALKEKLKKKKGIGKEMYDLVDYVLLEVLKVIKELKEANNDT